MSISVHIISMQVSQTGHLDGEGDYLSRLETHAVRDFAPLDVKIWTRGPFYFSACLFVWSGRYAVSFTALRTLVVLFMPSNLGMKERR